MRDKKIPTKTKSRKRRGNSRYFVFFLLILMGLTALGFGSYRLLANLDWLNVRKLEISGNSAVADSLLRGALQPYLGQNLLKLDQAEIKAQVSGFARVKSVKVKRKLFNTLLVKITERKPTLYVKSLEGDLHPVDEEGIVLEHYGGVYTENLPLVNLLVHNADLHSGQKLSNASLDKVLATHRRILGEAPDFAPNISEYYTIDNTVYIIDARNGLRLIPSEKNLARQLSRYEFVRDNGNVNQSSILDLRTDNQVVVRAGG
ncbi:MAG: FtsQ-type POTRA domain-containing protein [Candidatus Cloacimonetes bacterium]|jgi:cell division septal protein FtsQ|nr:FtsQ-type POTRA domain-containing protein [Candidatus Cloacimonadota bacterium]